MAVTKLVLVRHGESQWNQENRFTGWYDVDLSDKGRTEAKAAGQLLKKEGFVFDFAYTSVLKRAIHTLWNVLDELDQAWLPVEKTWRLNERHYGALQGLNKAETKEKYGNDQFMAWRRSYDTPPPELEDDSEYSQAGDPRYAGIENPPRTECLLDVVKRFVPYFTVEILPRLESGETVLVAAHGNSLRALVKHLDNISDEDIAGLNIPTGIPLVYRFAADGSVTNPGGEYLDPAAAEAGAAAVAAQGGK